jgi:RimJ/RimL family protein N-acetyltransferase
LSDGVNLRDVEADDLPAFFEHQTDREAAELGHLVMRERPEFDAHWQRLIADDSIDKQTITWNGEVAGSMVSFDKDRRRVVGYWLDRDFWGRGIATEALAQFLAQLSQRPLYAEVAKANRGSVRVLEKCGFTLHSEDNGDLVFRFDG